MQKSMTSSPSKKHARGFTLIELLITISIMMITFAIALVNYMRFLEKQKLHQSGSRVETMLKDARLKAQNGYLGNDEIGYCDQLAGVEVSSSEDGDGIVSVAGRLNCADDTSLTYETATLNQSEVMGNHFSIIFLPLRGALVTVGGSQVSSGSATLSRDDSAVIFNLDQGASINVIYQ